MVIFCFFAIITGACGITAQMLMVRELLVGFLGNELVIGIIFAHWLLLQAAGAFLFGKLVDKAKKEALIFIALQALFVLFLPACIYFTRTYRYFFHLPFGKSFDLLSIFWISFLLLLPLGICHGALFSVLAKMARQQKKALSLGLGSVYALVTAGTVIAGSSLSFFLLGRFSSFQIVYVLNALILAGLFFYGFSLKNKRVANATLFCAVVLSLFLCFLPPGEVDRDSLRKQWSGVSLLESRNSVYGNIAATRQSGQTTFFYNGRPVVSSPHPDTFFTEFFAHIPLLMHKDPHDLLIVNAGAGGLLHEIRKHPLKAVTYVELDPLLIAMLKTYPSRLTAEELSDPRLKLVHKDARLFLKENIESFDNIFLGLSKPSDLASNRFFTEEFFALAKSRLKKEGIFSFLLPGSLIYISEEVRDLDFSILNALAGQFRYVRLLPAEDAVMVCASDDGAVLTVTKETITARLMNRKIDAVTLLPEYVSYLFDQERLRWFQKATAGATKEVNRDARPFALYMSALLWNKQFHSSQFLLKTFKHISVAWAGIVIFLLSVVLILVSRGNKKTGKKLALTYSIATTGFFGMLFNLSVIFAFQVAYGYLYQMLALLVTALMAGSVLGSVLMVFKLKRVRAPFKEFLILETGILLLVLTFLFVFFAGGLSSVPVFVFICFSVLAGCFLGAEFCLAGSLYQSAPDREGETAGILYGFDLAGGWFAGILGGIAFLPLLGLQGCAAVIILCKISSIALFLACQKDFL